MGICRGSQIGAFQVRIISPRAGLQDSAGPSPLCRNRCARTIPRIGTLLLARTIERDGPARLIGAQIGGAAAEIVVDAGQADSGVDGGRAGTKLKVKIRRIVKRARIGSGRRRFLENVVIHQNAVPVLAGGLGIFFQSFESSRLFPKPNYCGSECWKARATSALAARETYCDTPRFRRKTR